LRVPPAYQILRAIARWWVQRIVDVRVEGLYNVPESGPCLIVPNHQSAIDPLLVQGMCPRLIHTMTKSTQFTSPLFRTLLWLGRAFPVRRYRVDPQSVRVLLRRIEEGEAVCLYPEGERTWDGSLQPLRRGAVRVMLRCGVPVIPVGIEGSYDAWPRWSSRPRRGCAVKVRFGAPLVFGAHGTREEREAALPLAEETLRMALLELSGEAARVPQAGEAGDARASMGDARASMGDGGLRGGRAT
jgi:1-acyl-sn-glycerol-3-phosphate acyltransferase